ncbi:MAG: hypothetical protein JRC90_11195, partial [Deltaproteobacteria bacterium]|nr:hypothetical protein [Deltaproteobacteria bacterium]
MSKVAESASYGGNIYALTEDGTYVYCGGAVQTIWQIDPSNMNKVAESANYGGGIYALTSQEIALPETAQGGSESTVATLAEGKGQKSARYGSEAQVDIIVEGTGEAVTETKGGSEIQVVVLAEAAGVKSARSPPTEVSISITAEGGGQKQEQSTSKVPVIYCAGVTTQT